jgi:UDP-N-acetylmuramoylalanine--D-glutamate ligase
MTLFGYGVTNQAIARRFGGCKIFDDKFISPSVDEWGNELLPTHMFDSDSSRLEIVTPGIAPSHPLVQNARNLKSEYDFFAEELGFSIWISGTNGKTSTTEMITHLLAKWGAKSGGNIGTPLAMMGEAKIKVLETSSFSMHYTKVAKPNIYVLLPITPDHLSWHGSFEEYEMAKLSVLERMEEGEAIVLPAKYKDIETHGYKICYEGADDLAEFFGIDVDKIEHREPFLLNAILALGVSKILFDEIDYELINSYKIGEHRVEELKDALGRLWVDDSKATNANATAAALKRYREKKVHLIFGGDDKSASLEEAFEVLKSMNATLYLIGSNIDRSKKLCEKYGVAFKECELLPVAIKEIASVHDSASVALLSPAAASLDQFSSYKQRGEMFKKMVLDLKK